MSHRLALAAILAALLALLTSRPQAQTRSFDLLTATVADIHAAVDAGALTYERLVRIYLDRIASYDTQGPRLRAVLAVNPRAEEIARTLDEERQTRGRRSPLHGIPIAVKDNVDVSDLATTGGNAMFAGTRPALDATIIARLREAGAIILAKTNLDELALSTRGFSTVGGQTLNPYDLTRNPGGSSSGTAVAVTASFATLGIATETGVSIRSPATNSSIVGIAPSRGLVSRAGVIPVSFTQDRVGSHAKTVIDAALLLEAIRGFDAADLSTAAGLGRTLSQSLAQPGTGLEGKRVGVLRDLFRQGAEFEPINQRIDLQLRTIPGHGAVLVDSLSTRLDLVAMMPTLRVNSYELRPAFDAYLLRRGPASPVKTFADLVASGRYLRGEALEARFEETMKAGELDRNREYLERLRTQHTVREALIGLMDQHQLDALVYPMKSVGASPIGSADAGVADNNISAVTGLPAIVVPAGTGPQGLPIAVEFLGRPFAEATLVAIAHGFEQATHARLQPPATPQRPGERFAY